MSPPSCCAIITRAASRDTRNEPLAITSCWMSQSCAVVSSSGLDSDSPALFTTRSTPPNASTPAASAAATASSSDTSAATPIATSAPPSSSATACGLGQVEVGDDHAAALGGDPGGDGLADPGRRAGDQGDPGGQRLGLRHPGQLGLLQGPVLDAELLRLADRRVGRHRLGAAHHVDGVDVELAGHPGGLLVACRRRTCPPRAPARWPGRRRGWRGSPAVALRS